MEGKSKKIRGKGEGEGGEGGERINGSEDKGRGKGKREGKQRGGEKGRGRIIPPSNSYLSILY